MIRVEDLTFDHVVSANDDIRLEDRMEWLAGCGCDVLEALSNGSFTGARVALDEEGRVLCFWGADPDGDRGAVWLVATRWAPPRAFSLHKHLRPELEALHARFPILHCWADSRNVVHHKWLMWLGFTFLEERHYGLLGLPFKHFEREQPCV